MYNFDIYGYEFDLRDNYSSFSDEQVLIEAQTLARKAESSQINDLAHPGVYGIFIKSRLVYIGQSQDMLVRYYSHLIRTNLAKTNKYTILREALERGWDVNFVPMYYSTKVDKASLQADLDEAESRLIRAFVPPLNVVIPLEDDIQVENVDSYSVGLNDIKIY